jgi:hypothetical protein
VDRRLAGCPAGECGREDTPLTRILSLLGLPHEIDRDGPVRDALVVQTYRLSRAGEERKALDEAFLNLIQIKNLHRSLPLRGVRLCRALRIPGTRRAEEAGRKAGIVPFHSDDVLDSAAAQLLDDVEKLIASPRKAAKMAGKVLKILPGPKLGVVDAETLRLVRLLATGVRNKGRGSRARARWRKK